MEESEVKFITSTIKYVMKVSILLLCSSKKKEEVFYVVDFQGAIKLHISSLSLFIILVSYTI